MPMFAKPSVPIYGFVGVLRLTVRTGNESYDGDLLGYARERHRQLEGDIDREVQEMLGPDFEVLSVEFRKGSLEVVIVLGAVGTFYMGFSRYESFIKSVNLLVSQIKGLLQRFFGDAPGTTVQTPVSVTGSWQPGPVVTAANQMLSVSSGIDSSHFVLGYLLVSHAALLGVLLWLIVRHLK